MRRSAAFRPFLVGVWRRMPFMARDALLACVVAITALTVSALEGWWRGQAAEITDVGAAAAWAAPILVACAPLALRRRLPLTAVVASAMMMLALGLALERDAGIWVLGLIVASAAYHRHRLRSVLLIGSVAWAVAVGLGGRSVPDLATVSIYAAAGAAPVAVGYALRLRADRAVQAARLQRAREEQARSQEAARIAREVHDVVGHHLSAIRLQAVGARRALAGHDCEADRALAGIADLSAEALVEIRALLETLVRSDREDHARSAGLADLPALAERSGGPELAVALEVDPRLGSTVHPETAACAYRIVQEALTNVARHSTAALASVTVRAVSNRVVVTIDDPGPPRPPAGGEPADDGVLNGERRGGQGLAGMRERVAALGGHCHTGPHGRAGWRVHASLPVLPQHARDEHGSAVTAGGAEPGPSTMSSAHSDPARQVVP
ncbi:histidine kinase [Nonomuraea fuscirosea]|uniref:sensor histidine kinase n=1 Tax=Nonomuraea fuscirosea TaxID=1291556 RepID=UPI002DD8F48A|nr:histidine kinase [Nonomuraea fuscirosea]WSA48391.1 histidine kinase [Nonomuraea fuscirosea]